MQPQEVILDGRKYQAYVSPDEQQGAYIIIGPPEGLVDEFGLDSERATKLHNILYDRGIYTYADAIRKGVLAGVLQELFSMDVQLITDAFSRHEQETVPNP